MATDGGNAFMAWLDSLPNGAQAQIESRIKAMAPLQKTDWPRKWVSALKGYDGIYELRTPWQNVQYRPLYCYGPDQRQITLLTGAIEKDDNLPLGTLKTATERQKLILLDRRRVRDHIMVP